MTEKNRIPAINDRLIDIWSLNSPGFSFQIKNTSTRRLSSPGYHQRDDYRPDDDNAGNDDTG